MLRGSFLFTIGHTLIFLSINRLFTVPTLYLNYNLILLHVDILLDTLTDSNFEYIIFLEFPTVYIISIIFHFRV